MSVVIKLTFPAGRYHATPWGRHVNEGVAEWPPSPWRLLRAIVAVWKRTCRDLSEEQVQRVLAALLHPPQMKLPAFRVAHTRHYMPWEKKGPADRTLVFDTFVAIARSEPLFVGWPQADLSTTDRMALSRLLGNLTSLGRAESWVHAELHYGAVELRIGEAAADDPNPVSVLCPEPATALNDANYPAHDTTKLAKGKVNPSDYLFDCPRWHLCLDTQTINAARWSTVPGAKWVSYTRPTEDRQPSSKRAVTSRRAPTVARFILDGPVLPLITDTIRVAEAFRVSAMSQFRKYCENHPELGAAFFRSDQQTYASVILAGKDAAGEKLQSHDHAHFLPTATASDPRHINQVTVYAPAGFGSLEITALNRLRVVYVGELRCSVQLVGLGGIADFNHPLLGKSTTWTSLTPCIAHRHAKTRGRNRDIPLDPNNPRGSFLAASIRELCKHRGLPALLHVAAIEPGTEKPRHFHFRRDRRKPTDDARTRASGYLRLEFERPIQGPLCLGYNSHFGMGLFEATKDEP